MKKYGVGFVLDGCVHGFSKKVYSAVLLLVYILKLHESSLVGNSACN